MKALILKYLKAFFGGYIGGYVRVLYLKRFLKQYSWRQFNTILDAGCGTGDHSFLVAKCFPESTVYGYDLARSDSYKSNFRECLRKQTESGISNVVFKEKDLLNLNEQVKYDLVYSIDVLEHIPGNRKVIENIFSALKKGGIFYLAMPWDEANSRLLPAFFFKDSDTWTDKEHIGEQYSLDELTDLMKELGFKILEARYTFGIWGKLAWEMEKVFTFLGPTGSVFKPFLKMLGHLDIYKRNKEGALLVIAKRQ